MEDIKKILQDNKAIIGTQETLKGLQEKKVKRVYMAKNTPEMVQEDLKYYTKLNGVEIVTLELTNEELGMMCKKNFAISVLSERL